MILFSVLDLDAFERTNKAESLGVISTEGSSGNSGENLQDADFTCKLFRFLQLLCEGHNAGEHSSSNWLVDRLPSWLLVVQAITIS